ncbi:MAG: hypothetical protein U1F66_07330 [bacterium]
MKKSMLWILVGMFSLSVAACQQKEEAVSEQGVGERGNDSAVTAVVQHEAAEAPQLQQAPVDEVPPALAQAPVSVVTVSGTNDKVEVVKISKTQVEDPPSDLGYDTDDAVRADIPVEVPPALAPKNPKDLPEVQVDTDHLLKPENHGSAQGRGEA